MPSNPEFHCLKCCAPVAEAARACPGCATPFVGSGAFDKSRGPAPSALFQRLFAPIAWRRAA